MWPCLPNDYSNCQAAVDAALQVGLPEARIPLADAVVLVATAPKSNSAYDGINRAMDDVQRGKSGPIPRTLQNVHYDARIIQIRASSMNTPRISKPLAPAAVFARRAEWNPLL